MKKKSRHCSLQSPLHSSSSKSSQGYIMWQVGGVMESSLKAQKAQFSSHVLVEVGEERTECVCGGPGPGKHIPTPFVLVNCWKAWTSISKGEVGQMTIHLHSGILYSCYRQAALWIRIWSGCIGRDFVYSMTDPGWVHSPDPSQWEAVRNGTTNNTTWFCSGLLFPNASFSCTGVGKNRLILLIDNTLINKNRLSRTHNCKPNFAYFCIHVHKIWWILLKCRLWFSRFEKGPEIPHLY